MKTLCIFHGARNDGVDVSEIAKQFGGGGHRGAAGFTVKEPVHIR